MPKVITVNGHDVDIESIDIAKLDLSLSAVLETYRTGLEHYVEVVMRNDDPDLIEIAQIALAHHFLTNTLMNLDDETGGAPIGKIAAEA